MQDSQGRILGREAWCRVYGLGFGICGLWFRVQGLGFRAEDLGFKFQGLGFRV